MSAPYAVIVPVYDPEPGLTELCQALLKLTSVVLVVDDGSRNHVEAFDSLPVGVCVLRHAVNRGKGSAMKTALAELLASHPEVGGAVFADGDGQHRPEDVARVIAASQADDRVVFGVRDFSSKGVPFRSWWGNRWTSIEVGLRHGFWLPDTQTGLRAVPSRLFQALLALPGARFEYECGWFALLRRLKERIDTVPIETVYRSGNRSSHFRPIIDTFLTQRAILKKITFSPLSRPPVN